MKNKKVFILSLGIILLIFIIFFCIYYYKTNKIGNTMINKSEEEIINYILNIKSYNAKMDITVETNKNKTKYVVTQSLENFISKQEVIEPTNIAGVITEYDGTNLKIRNNRLNLENTFQNYQYIVNNKLWLNAFIEDYKNDKNTKSITNKDNEIIVEVKNNKNEYNFYKKLYIDKKTAKPIKLIIQDVNQKTLVYILYTEITISK